MARKKIFIDAGHNNSSFNTGAVGNGMREQDITYEVSKNLHYILRNDFEIMLSRPTKETNLGRDNNSSINARWQASNNWGADYFISIHVNAAGGTGAETFYWGHEAKKFALTIQETYAKAMALRSRRTEATDRFGVIRQTNCPAILLELAFIDAPLHKPDIDILRYKRYEMAQAIAKGIYKYFKMAPSKEFIENLIEDTGTCDYILPYSSESYFKPIGTVNLKYRGKVYNIKADKINDRFVTTIGELSKVFGHIEIPIREILEQAGVNVAWEEESRTITVN